MLTKKRRGTGKSTRRPRHRRVRTSRQQEIFERAARLIQEKGFAGMSVQRVADELQFSKANFYYHIKSKEELLYEIFVENLDYTIRHVEKILARDILPPEKFRAIVDFYARMMMERAAVMTVWFQEKSHLSPEHLKEVNQLEAHIAEMISAFYEDGIARGFFRRMDTRLARIAVFGMCFNLTRWQHVLGDLSLEAIAEQLQTLASSGLLKS